MMKQLAEIFYHFLLEFILGLLLLFFFFIPMKQLPPFGSISCLCLGGFLIFIILLRKFTGKGKWVYLCIIFPFLIFAGFKLGFSDYTAGFMGIFIFIRGISLYSDVSGHSGAIFLFVSFVVGLLLLIYSGMSHYSFQNAILVLLILQILLVLLGGFFGKWEGIKENRIKFISYYGAILAGAAGIGAIITFSIKFFKDIFLYLLILIVKGISLLTIPILKGMEFLISLIRHGKRKTPNINTMSGNAEEHIQNLTTGTSHWWMLVILIPIVAGLIYYFYKKKIPSLQAEGPEGMVEVSAADFKESGGQLIKKRVKPPEDTIRREIFQLEKFAEKLKLGRGHAETLDEWWLRAGFTETEEVIKVYENVRYGEIPAAEEDVANVKAELSRYKEQLKEMARQNKQNLLKDS